MGKQAVNRTFTLSGYACRDGLCVRVMRQYEQTTRFTEEQITMIQIKFEEELRQVAATADFEAMAVSPYLQVIRERDLPDCTCE